MIDDGQAFAIELAGRQLFGQRQTDSGNVSFDKVYLPSALVLQAPGQAPTAQATLRSQVAQLVMTNLYLGIAQGAYIETPGASFMVVPKVARVTSVTTPLNRRYQPGGVAGASRTGDATDLAGNAASAEGTVEVLRPKRKQRGGS